MSSISLKIAMSLAALMVAECVLCAPSNVGLGELCIRDSAQYIAAGPIDESVKERLDEAHKFYANILSLFSGVEISRDYKESMKALGVSDGCQKLKDHVDAIRKKVPCYASELQDKAGLKLIAESSEGAKRVIEAYFACSFAAGMPEGTNVDYMY